MSNFVVGSGYVLILPVLIAQWVGVVGLAGSGRDGAWRTMTTGTVVSSLGMVLQIILFVLMARGFPIGSFSSSGGTGAITPPMMVLLLSRSVSGLGSLLFAIGFALHGMKGRRLRQRIDELEAVIAAQSDQLEQRSAASSA